MKLKKHIVINKIIILQLVYNNLFIEFIPPYPIYNNTDLIFVEQLPSTFNVTNIGGIINLITLEPNTLPDGLMLDENTGNINGTSLYPFEPKQYKITFSNNFGSNSVILNISCIEDIKKIECKKEYNIWFRIKVVTYNYGDRIGFIFSDSINNYLTVHPHTLSNNIEYIYDFCLTSDEYNLKLYTNSSSLDGWALSYISTYIDYNQYEKYSMLYNDTDEYINCIFIYNFIVNFGIYYSNLWEYSTEEQKNNSWCYTNSTIKWDRLRIPEIPKIKTTTLYMRSRLLLDFDCNVTGVYIIFKHLSGVILRINGDIIYSHFLPDNVTPKTYALNSFERMTDIKLILPVDLFVNEVMVSLEYHKMEKEESINIGDFILMTLSGDNEGNCTIINHFGSYIPKEDNNYKLLNLKKDTKYAFDYLKTLTIFDEQNPINGTSSLYLYFDENLYFYYNRITIFRYREKYEPRNLKMESYINNKWVLIHDYHNISYNNNTCALLSGSNSVYYNKFRFNISSDIYRELDFYDIGLHVCNLN